MSVYSFESRQSRKPAASPPCSAMKAPLRDTVPMPTYSLIALEAFTILNGVFLCILDGGRGDLVPDLVGVLIRVDPTPMQIAVASNIDAGAAAGYVGHVSDSRA